MVHHFPIYNVSICDFNALFEYIKIQLQAQCIKYNINKCNEDYKKLLIHCTVKAMCDVAVEQRNTKLVFFANESQLNYSDMLCINKTQGWLLRVFTSIQKNLPLKWYFSSHEFEYFQNLIEQNKGISFLQQMSNQQVKSYTFSKALKFATKNNLSFLNRSYFNDLKMRYKLLNT